jgi:hypothetical protein
MEGKLCRYAVKFQLTVVEAPVCKTGFSVKCTKAFFSNRAGLVPENDKQYFICL